ncbi:hypothetical protein [Umezawaea sp. Da 62-37]|uniref:hypothetical protein n=1 Tax=Umezawaea sp. Da 62-37 TaxID=3075927 RepID=UPI0028F72957|nr:hypothetical protein [Umezawaea sp. Da 62-37]WNV85958.1 hypothetical protein RM788_48920 [Umezawaea sp. Da 62-37]
MRSDTRWHVIPTTARACWISLALGIVAVVSTATQMVSAHDVAVLPMIALVLGVALVGLATTGLMAPRLRGR